MFTCVVDIPIPSHRCRLLCEIIIPCRSRPHPRGNFYCLPVGNTSLSGIRGRLWRDTRRQHQRPNDLPKPKHPPGPVTLRQECQHQDCLESSSYHFSFPPRAFQLTRLSAMFSLLLDSQSIRQGRLRVDDLQYSGYCCPALDINIFKYQPRPSPVFYHPLSSLRPQSLFYASFPTSSCVGRMNRPLSFSFSIRASLNNFTLLCHPLRGHLSSTWAGNRALAALS